MQSIPKIYFYTILLIIISFLIISCNKNQRNETPIAQVGDKVLYLSDIADVFSANITQEDSVRLLNDYANRWGRKQLILKKAEGNLSSGEKNVTAELEDYRASLLIFRYEQAYITQRLDTTVRESELKAFYNENNSNFQLLNPLVKSLYIKVPSDAPTLKKIRELYRSTSEKDANELENICFQGAVNYDYFNGEWINFAVLAKELPLDMKSYENDLINKRYIETNDQQFTYFISIRDLKVKGSIAPFEHIKENIRSIILNKRKQDMVKKLENDIYNEALNLNELKINIGK
ncbi:MAG: hypothetical protein LBL90_10670 [Prevotellaceae bacterium]|jgi:hypothetical protein|nr:hypothetical protein [Prevotellaceae bacterium]